MCNTQSTNAVPSKKCPSLRGNMLVSPTHMFVPPGLFPPSARLPADGPAATLVFWLPHWGAGSAPPPDEGSRGGLGQRSHSSTFMVLLRQHYAVWPFDVGMAKLLSWGESIHMRQQRYKETTGKSSIFTSNQVHCNRGLDDKWAKLHGGIKMDKTNSANRNCQILGKSLKRESGEEWTPNVTSHCQGSRTHHHTHAMCLYGNFAQSYCTERVMVSCRRIRMGPTNCYAYFKNEIMLPLSVPFHGLFLPPSVFTILSV